MRRVKQDGKGVGFRELVETLLGDMVGGHPQRQERQALSSVNARSWPAPTHRLIRLLILLISS